MESSKKTVTGLGTQEQVTFSILSGVNEILVLLERYEA